MSPLFTVETAWTVSRGPALTGKVAVYDLEKEFCSPQVHVLVVDVSTFNVVSATTGTPAGVSVSVFYHDTNVTIRLTFELGTNCDGETCGVLEGTGVSSRFVELEGHLLLEVRVVGEGLVSKNQRIVREDLPKVKIVLDLVNVHILEDEGEVLVGVNIPLGMVIQVRLDVRTRNERDLFGRSDKTELLRVLTSARFELEPTIAVGFVSTSN